MCFAALAPIGAAIGSAISSIPSWVGTAVSIAGTGLAVAGTLSAAQAQAQALRYSAQVADAEAQRARFAGQFEADQIREQARINLARSRAAAGASGIAFEGSPLEALAYSATQYELDALAALYGAETIAAGRQSGAALSRFQAGRTALSGYLGAGTQLLRGASTWGRDVVDWFAPRQTGVTVNSGPLVSPERLTGRVAGPI